MTIFHRPTRVYLFPLTRLDGVMLGVAIALLLEQGHRRVVRPVSIAAVCGVAVLIMFAPPWFEAPKLSLFLIMPLTTVGAFVLVWTIVSSKPAALINRVLALPLLRYVGDRSYSIYLWHYFIGVALIAGGEHWQGSRVFLWQVAASLMVAVAVYEAIERPARARLNRRIDVSTADQRRCVGT